MTFQTATKMLTAEDIRHMYETPVEILPAQGENIVSIIDRIFAYSTNKTTLIPFSDGGLPYLCYGDKENKASSYLLNNFLTNEHIINLEYMLTSAEGIYTMQCNIDQINSYVNAPIFITNQGSPFKGGNFGVIVKIIYIVLSLDV